MSNLKDTLSSVVAYISIAITILQAAVMGYNQWIATATAAPTLMEYVQLAILIGIGVIGVLTGRNADGSAKNVAQLAAQDKLAAK